MEGAVCWSHPNPRIDDLRPMRSHHDRIQVQLGDLEQVLDHDADAEDHLDQRRYVGRFGSAVAGQQRIGLELADHLVRVARRKRRESHRHILDQLHQNATGATGDDGTELPIVYDAHDHFPPRAGHPLHEKVGNGVVPRATRRGVRPTVCSQIEELVPERDLNSSALGPIPGS